MKGTRKLSPQLLTKVTKYYFVITVEQVGLKTQNSAFNVEPNLNNKVASQNPPTGMIPAEGLDFYMIYA